MERNDLKNILAFEDVICEDVSVDERGVKTSIREINGLSLEIKSGEIYFVVSDPHKEKTAFTNLISGRIPIGTKTYGKITYNGHLREWDDWSKKIRILNIQEELESTTFDDYLELELEIKYSDLTDKDMKNRKKEIILEIEKILGEKKICWDEKLALIVLHILLCPDILVIIGFREIINIEKIDFITDLLQKFVKDNNSIVIMEDNIEENLINPALSDFYYGRGTVLVLIKGYPYYFGRMENYREYILKASGCDSSEREISYFLYNVAFEKIKKANEEKMDSFELKGEIASCNNLKVEKDSINVREIFKVIRGRLFNCFPVTLQWGFAFCYFFYCLQIFVFISQRKFNYLTEIIPDLKSCSGKEAFFVAFFLYMQTYYILTPLVSVFFPSEVSLNLDYTEYFVMGKMSPYSFMIARYFTYNLPFYLLQALVIFSLWCVELRKYINIMTAVFMILISFVFILLYDIVYQFFISLVKYPLFAFPLFSFYNMLFVNIDILSAYKRLEGNFLNNIYFCFILINPLFIFSVIMDVLALNCAYTSGNSTFRNIYLKMRPDVVEVLKGYFDIPDGDLFSSLSLKNILPEDLYKVIKLSPNTFRVSGILFLVIMIFIISSLLFGRRHLSTNIRLKLMNGS